MKDKTEILRELNQLMTEYDMLPSGHPSRVLTLAKIEMLGWVLNKKIQTYPGGAIKR